MSKIKQFPFKGCPYCGVEPTHPGDFMCERIETVTIHADDAITLQLRDEWKDAVTLIDETDPDDAA